MAVVDPAVRVDYGHRAFAAILGTGPLPWRVAGRLMTTRLVDPAARRAYHWVATHRSRLPGGTAACAIPPSAGDQPQASSQPSTSEAGRVLGPA